MAYDSIIAQASATYGIPQAWIRGVIAVESSWRERAVSGAGAIGLMQIMPATGAGYGVSDPQDLFDPIINVDVGTHLLADLRNRFSTLEEILSAYNSGKGNLYLTNAGVAEYVRKVITQISDYLASDPLVATAGGGAGILLILVLMWAWKKKGN